MVRSHYDAWAECAQGRALATLAKKIENRKPKKAKPKSSACSNPKNCQHCFGIDGKRLLIQCPYSI